MPKIKAFSKERPVCLYTFPNNKIKKFLQYIESGGDTIRFAFAIGYDTPTDLQVNSLFHSASNAVV